MKTGALMQLSSICNLNMGQSPDSSSYNQDGEGLPFFQGNADFGDLHPKVRYWCNRPTKIAKAGDILLSVRAPIGALNIATEECCIGRGLAALSVKENVSDTRYLLYALRSRVDELVAKGTGSTFKAISKTTLEDIRIPLPVLVKQREIAKQLDKLSALVALRKQQIEQLDLLIKSRFIEMFGDPQAPSLHPVVSLETVANIVSGITKGRKVPIERLHSVPYMRVANVKDGYIDLSEIKMIEVTDSEIERYRIIPGDILMTEGGDPDKLGRGAIWIHQIDNCIHQNHIFRVRLQREKVNPLYFVEYLKQPMIKQYFFSCAKQTTGIASINMSQLKAAPTIVPPLDLQNAFAAFVGQVDKSKFISLTSQLNSILRSILNFVVIHEDKSEQSTRLWYNIMEFKKLKSG
ncbi:restriction endonuclease subunit S [Cohnella zeiphila]|uniref:Restriction endonuclease subunit S n=1 Tax=Cohnella zeiphila TaxID=2761120 RepID=A0A7X0VWD0_9BACL|nr:restriction endonuclease subunit S [Cohnella zeiphila]MBB6732816.1 restriction endonuclease subunit S [Cohnella zeiphila]